MVRPTGKIKQLLVYLTHKIIAKYNPFVIGITGSVGKTSTRHAIACALKYKFKLREPIRNYNNELGIPFTIFGTEGLENKYNRFGWIRVFAKAFMVWLLPQDYPKLLVLEYGIDRQADMDKLVNIVKPNLTVLTTVGISHKEFFENEAQIAFEKGKLAACLNESDTFVFNADDENVVAQTSRTKAKKLSFGSIELSHNPNVELVSVQEVLSVDAKTVIKIKTPSRIVEVTVPVLGTAHVQAVLAAVAVAEAMDVETDFIVKGLADYRAVPGRLNVLAGIKKTILIDDSYNAAPLSTKEALKLLGRFPGGKKIAVLGDMLELGDESEKSHAEVGSLVAELKVNQLVTVGELGKQIAAAAKQAGMNSENIASFETSDEAKNFVLQNIEPESIVLVKGSQGVRMEKVSKELLAEPMSATQVLPRQYGKWLES